MVHTITMWRRVEYMHITECIKYNNVYSTSSSDADDPPSSPNVSNTREQCGPMVDRYSAREPIHGTESSHDLHE